MKLKENRVKLLALDADTLTQLIREACRTVERGPDGEPILRHVLRRLEPPLPDDAQILDSTYSFDRQATIALVWSSTYPSVEPGCLVPDSAVQVMSFAITGPELAAMPDKQGRKPFEFLGKP